MHKNILVLHYSQTGQLTEILDEFMNPLESLGNIDNVRVTPKNEFPFPWSAKEFFAGMPACVKERPIELNNFDLKHEKYDLIVFGYQPWFLSPSLPATSILQHPAISKVLKNTPVITVIGARNMWMNAQEMVKRRLLRLHGHLVGNVALIDKHNNLASAASIVYWLLYGKKEKLWGIFPKAGVSESDIKGARIYGELAKECLKSDNWDNYQAKVAEKGGVQVRTNIMFIEKRAPRLFSIWANVIDKRKNKVLWTNAFKFYLFFALFIVSPVLLLIYNILVVPFTQKTIRANKNYYKGVILK